MYGNGNRIFKGKCERTIVDHIVYPKERERCDKVALHLIVVVFMGSKQIYCTRITHSKDTI